MDTGEGPRSPTSPAAQLLLALLASSPCVPVPRDVLCAELWADGSMPVHPEATLHTRMTRLRDWLGIPRHELVAAAGAYTLVVDPEQVDLSRFHRAVDAALGAHDPAVALAAATEALATWGGPPWPGLSSPRLDLAREHALARHRSVTEARLRALLDRARPLEALDALGPLVAAHPEHETWHALLVRALHAAGRPREAVHAFLAARRVLRDELAVEPGEELRAAYRAVLVDRSRVPDDDAPPALVGREDVLEAIAGAVEDETADGRVVVVEGEAGIGKSLVLAAARYAARRDAQVVRGTWEEGAAPLAAWIDALGAPPPGPAGAPVPWVRRRLAELAVDGPVLVTLDDAHRADSASLGALTGAARHGLPPGVVVLVAARRPDATPRPAWTAALADLAREQATVLLPLAELPAPEVVELVRRRLGRFGPEAVGRLSDLVRARAGGHPLHLCALLDVLASRPDGAAALAAVSTVPPRLRAAFDHQVAQLGDRARRSLETLAVLRPVPTRALAGVLGQSAPDVVEDLREALALGLAVADDDAVDLRHELVAAALRDGVPSAVQVVLHAARLDHPDPSDDAFVRLRHTLGAATALGEAAVARARRDAGVLAYDRRALDEAAALLDAAAAVLPDDAVVDVHRGLVLAALGRAEESDDLLDAAIGTALAGPDPGLVVKAAVGDEALGRTVSGDARRRARLHRADAATRAMPPAPRFELLVALLREESLAGVARPDLVAEMRTLADAPGASAVVRARAAALEVRQLVEGPEPARRRLALARDAAELARRCGDPTVVLDATELLLTAALGAGEVEQALALRDELEVEARRWHRPRLMWAAQVLPSALLLARGSYDEADAAASASLQLGQELGVGDALPAFGVHLMIRAWMTGTADTLGDLAEQATKDNPAMPAWAVSAAVARARAGRSEEARSFLAEFRARRAATTSRLFDRPALCLAACAAWSLGDLETARLVREELPADPDAVVILGYGAVITGPAALFAGIAAMTLGEYGTARHEVAVAEKLATAQGWAPWIDAAARVGAFLDGADVELPLGMGSGMADRDGGRDGGDRTT